MGWIGITATGGSRQPQVEKGEGPRLALVEKVEEVVVTDLLRRAVWGGLSVFLAGLLVAIPKDVARTRARREGRRLKGPELVTAAQFNRRCRADGIGFAQQRRSLWRTSWVRVPRAIESSHFLIIGDSVTGKSPLIRP